MTGTVPRNRNSKKTKQTNKSVDIEIFAGAGGMTLGLQRAGFRFSHLFELDSHTCRTLENNHVTKGGVLHGDVHQADITKLDWSNYSTQPVRLLVGGAPCQPFSLAGRHLADKDDRNMFPEVLRAIRALQPQAVLLENVQGLARPPFRPYLEYILRQLSWPSVRPKNDEEWQDHDRRIWRHQTRANDEPEYHVNWDLLEAADYGVPQNRRRVFIVAMRTDIFEEFEFPLVTHKRESLMRIQNNGDYWKSRGIKEPKKNGVDVLDLENFIDFKAWETVRDALAALPQAANSNADSGNNHWLIPGARIYRGHSGSALDWPSKTIKAGVHGVPGGENIVLMDDGSHRYFTLRETARIQGFPDEFVFYGARLHVTRQIGNAVPVDLAAALGRKLFRQMSNTADKKPLTGSLERGNWRGKR